MCSIWNRIKSLYYSEFYFESQDRSQTPTHIMVYLNESWYVLSIKNCSEGCGEIKEERLFVHAERYFCEILIFIFFWINYFSLRSFCSSIIIFFLAILCKYFLCLVFVWILSLHDRSTMCCMPFYKTLLRIPWMNIVF